MLFYVQADTLLPPRIDGLSTRFDGFAMGQSGANFTVGPDEQSALDTLARDELEIFSGAITPRIIQAEPEILLDRGAGITACLTFDNAVMAHGVATHYAKGTGLRRIVCNHVTGGSRDPIDCEAIVELCAADAKALVTALGTQDDAPWRAASFAMVAQEHLLWDTRSSRLRLQ